VRERLLVLGFNSSCGFFCSVLKFSDYMRAGCQFGGFYLRLILQSHRDAAVVTAGDVRVYLVNYIFCIIDYHICRDIFGRLYILYNILPYMSGYI
jgi:hypothetical protein